MLKLLAICVLLLVSYVKTEPKPVTKQTVQIEPDKIANILQLALQCVSETGADPALLIQIRNRKYSDDVKVKEFFSCVFKRTGLSTKKGQIKVQKMLDIYPEKADKEALKTVIGECNKDNGEDPQDRIFHFFKCFQENTPVRVSLQ